jgi:hypothetical protein
MKPLIAILLCLAAAACAVPLKVPTTTPAWAPDFWETADNRSP